MLFQHTLLANDDDVNVTSTSISTSTISSQTTYNLINSMSLLALDETNSNTLTDDVPNDSSTTKLHECCQTEMANKSMTITTMKFPVNLKNTTIDALLFPLKSTNSTNLAKQQYSLQEMPTKNVKENLLTSKKFIHHQMTRQEFTLKKFPILNMNKINLQKTFPITIFEKPEISKFQILRFPNDLNMPQATLETNSAQKSQPPPPTTIVTSLLPPPPKIITQSTNLAITAAIHGRNVEQDQEQQQQQRQQKWQKSQVHCDHQERAVNNDDYDVTMFEISNELTAKIITMDNEIFKNENFFTTNIDGNRATYKHFAESNEMCTHNNVDEVDENDDDDDDECKLLVKEIAINGNTANISKMPPFIYDDNDVYNICDIYSIQLDGVIRPQYSDVRDTSSKEVLVDNTARDQCEKYCPLKALENVDTATVIEKATHKTTSLPSPSSSKSSFSPFYELTSHIAVERAATAIATATPSAITAYDKLPNFELLPNYYALELVESNEGNWTETKLDTWHDFVDHNDILKNSKIQIENICSSNKKEKSASGANDYSGKYKLRSVFSNEMTLTKLDKHDHDEATQSANNSEPPSPISGLNGGELQDSNYTPSFHEMKFEMRSAKGALPSTALERNKEERRSSILPAISTTKTSALKSNYHTNVDSLPTNNTMRSPSSKTLITQPENTPRSLAYTTRSSTKIGNELTRHPENEVNRTVSIDTVDSVLPERTRLRRQRRMASQGSVDKNEDPVERLNRLRARISGALSEVKGVLNKYSTETEPNEQNVINKPLNEPQAPKLILKKYNPETETNKQNTITKIPANEVQPLKLEHKEWNTEHTETSEQNTTTKAAIDPEPSKSDDGPVQFRFVRKVRRRSVFTEDEEDKINEKEAEIKLKIENSAEKELSAIEKQEINKTEDKKEKEAQSKVEETNDEGKDKPKETSEKESKETIEISEKFKTINNNEKPKKNENEANIDKSFIEIPKIEINKSTIGASKSSSVQDEHNKDAKIIKDELKIESKDANRRASTGAIKEIEPIEALKVYKIQRRPSDTAAVIKGRPTSPSQHLKNEVIIEKNNKVNEVTKTLKTTKEPELITSEISDLGKQTAITKENTATKDHKSTKQISENNIKLKDATKPAKRSSLKRSDSGRRASVAAVEKSKTDIKTQRRPSDSTTSIQTQNVDQTKASPPTAKPSLINRRPTPRVKAGSKVKRQSLKSNETDDISANALTVVDESMTTAGYTNKNEKFNIEPLPTQSIKAINDATSSSPMQTMQALTKLPTTLSTPSLPTVIDNARTKVSSQKFVTSPDQSISITDLPISLLQANVVNSQSNQLERQQVKDNIDTRSSVTVKEVSPLQQRKEIPIKNILPTIIDNIKNSKESSLPVNHAKQTLPEKSSINLTETSIATKTDDNDIKKPINQQEKIPVLNEAPLSPSQPIQCAQQVVVGASAAAAAIDTAAIDIVLDSVPNISKPITTTTLEQSTTSEVKNSNKSAASTIATACSSSISDATTTATKAAEFAVECNSSAQTITTASVTSTEAIKKEAITADKMPELQILPTPVKAVQIQPEQRKLAPFNLPKEKPPKKKIIFKKLVRQKSTEKSNAATTTTPSKTPKPTSAHQVEIPNDIITDNAENKDPIATEIKSEIQSLEPSPVIEEAPPKKPRKVKKKVIIKRQQRRLSVSDQTFFNNEINSTNNQEDEKPATEIETLEKAISYVTDDDDEEEPPPPALPLKGCMRQREFQVGELIMYAERYKRTQVRWKKGRVLERITSISYKLDIDGKEVPAHISYIKRYTDRKVSFGGKEYLEIDYEQIAEIEEKARSYSIWNMV